MTITMKNIFWEFVVAYCLTPIGFMFFGMIAYSISEKIGFPIFFGGDRAVGFSGIFLGVPISALFGIGIVDKIKFKSKGYNGLGLLTGFILSQCGTVIGIILMDNIGNITIPLDLFIIVCLALIGYNIKMIFKRCQRCV